MTGKLTPDPEVARFAAMLCRRLPDYTWTRWVSRDGEVMMKCGELSVAIERCRPYPHCSAGGSDRLEIKAFHSGRRVWDEHLVETRHMNPLYLCRLIKSWQ